MIQLMLAYLLHVANSGASSGADRDKFYALKERLLKRYGRHVDYHTQEIVKECWGYRENGCTGRDCRRCGGSGIYSRRWFSLEVWEWGGYRFHRPACELYVRPSKIDIHGRVAHRDHPVNSNESRLWLYLLCGEWRLFWREMTCHSYAHPGWCPLSRIQKYAMPLRMYLNWRRCWCGKTFWTRGTGWQICKSCRAQKPQSVSDEVPF